MKTKPLTFLLSLTFLFLFSGSSVVFGDDFQDGLDAINQKDYKTAFQKFKLLAERGDANAQQYLGLMYVFGWGITQQYDEALKWYKLSAKHGNAAAQESLGLMYLNGQGVIQNYVEAHKWFNISSVSGRGDTSRLFRGLTEDKMTPAQIAEAQKLAREWMEKHGQ